jgi:hypothetical protein
MDTNDLAFLFAVLALVAILLSGLVVLGAIALRFAGRRPGRRWGTTVAFLFGLQLGVMVLFTEGDAIQRAIVFGAIGLLTLGLLWRDRRVQAGAFLAASSLPWTLVWGYYVVQLAQGVPSEPFQTWTLFFGGLAPTLIGLGLMVAGDPLPPEPSPSAPPGRPGSRRVGIVAQTVLAPESIGPFPISEIAAFGAAIVTVLAVGLIGLPFPLEPVVQVVLGALADNTVRLVARPSRARRAYEAFSWLAEWEIARAKALTGRGMPMRKGSVDSWLEAIPDTPETGWIRVEGLAWLERFDEAREVIARMPVGTPYERFEQRHAMDYIDWMTGGEGDPEGLRAAADELDPGDEETRLRAAVALAIRESARIAAERGPEEALEPLLRARDLLGAGADRQLWRALWPRYLPIAVASALVITLVTVTPT